MNDQQHRQHRVTTAPGPNGASIASCTCGASRTSSYGPVLDSWRKEHYREVSHELRPLSLVSEDTAR